MFSDMLFGGKIQCVKHQKKDKGANKIMLKSEYLQRVYTQVVTRDPDQKEFHQAVLEVLESLDLIVDKHPEYEQKGIIETFVEPERMICFRVPWDDDQGVVHVNRG